MTYYQAPFRIRGRVDKFIYRETEQIVIQDAFEECRRQATLEHYFPGFVIRRVRQITSDRSVVQVRLDAKTPFVSALMVIFEYQARDQGGIYEVPLSLAHFWRGPCLRAEKMHCSASKLTHGPRVRVTEFGARLMRLVSPQVVHTVNLYVLYIRLLLPLSRSIKGT